MLRIIQAKSQLIFFEPEIRPHNGDFRPRPTRRSDIRVIMLFRIFHQLHQIADRPFTAILAAPVNQKRGKSLFSCPVRFRFAIIDIPVFPGCHTLCL